MSEKVQELPVVQVERYALVFDGGAGYDLHKSDDGDLCDYSAYAALLAERDALRDEADRRTREVELTYKVQIALKQRAERAEAELARLRVQGEDEIARLRALADLVPTDWGDPLLVGPQRPIGGPPYNGFDIERLLRAVKARMVAAIDAAMSTEQSND